MRRKRATLDKWCVCYCGQVYSREAYEALPSLEVDDGLDGCDWRRCSRCHAAVVVPFDSADLGPPRGSAFQIVVSAAGVV